MAVVHSLAIPAALFGQQEFTETRSPKGFRSVERNERHTPTPNLRMRITTPTGILVVYDAPTTPTHPDSLDTHDPGVPGDHGEPLDTVETTESPGQGGAHQVYLAWWRRYVDDVIHLYRYPIYNEADLLLALERLRNEFGDNIPYGDSDQAVLQPAASGADKSGSDDSRDRSLAPDSADAGPYWVIPTRDNVKGTLVPMSTPGNSNRFTLRGDPERIGCIPTAATLPDSPRKGQTDRDYSLLQPIETVPLPAPANNFTMDDLFEVVILEACSGGCSGVCCGVSCEDYNPCTRDLCGENPSGGAQCGYQPINPDGVCCDSFGNCCTGPYKHCNNVCCEVDQVCCNNDVCCEVGEVCCNLQCADPCSSLCIDCDDNNPCTDDSCSGGVCSNTANSDPCTDDGNPCTDDICSNKFCTHPPNSDPCADDGNPCTDDICSNKFCTHPPNSDPCADDGNPCTDDICSNKVCTHPANSDPCTDDGDICTKDECENSQCKHPPKCPTPQNCCNDGTCCDEVCDECINYGTLTPGTISVTQPVVCVGDTITFTLNGADDSGREKRVNCVVQSISNLKIEWGLTLPVGYPTPLPPVTGTGPSASVEAKIAGTYSVTFTVSADRDCPPTPNSITIGPKTADAFVADIVTPNGDPSTSAGANGTNERTYNTASTSPTVTVPCAAASVPDPSKLRWTIDDVGTIKATWSPSVSGDPNTGTGIAPTATFTGMPANFNDFGPKAITLTVDGVAGCQDTQVVEIFYPGTATNHPGGNATFPNWFHYYQQNEGSTNYTYGCVGIPPASWSSPGVPGSEHICHDAYDLLPKS